MNDLAPTFAADATPADFVSHLTGLAARAGTAIALQLLDDPRIGDARGAALPIDYATLDARARAFAARLDTLTAPGARVLLLLDTGFDYVAAFFGCLYAGRIAVPAFPPEPSRPQHQARLAAMARDCAATLAVIHAADRDTAAAFLPAGTIPLTVEEVSDSEAGAWQPRRPRASDIAFLQYTSGSTSTPKGVMVSHANLMANERAIRSGFGIAPGETILSWLPLYHDMGLIGGLLQPLFNGATCVLMSPRHFLGRPTRWLEAISRFRATISGGPDFAYRMCVERIDPDQLAGVDLSCWKVAFSGSEPVRAATMEAFRARFAGLGFAASAVHPCYGLAEATLFVTAPRRGSGLDAPAFDPARLAEGEAVPSSVDGVRMVSCGSPAAEHGVRILDPATGEDLPDGRIGEVVAFGPSIAQGYWNNPAATEATFPIRNGARLLRTGDLGLIRDGQLFLAGRAKDLIIVRGQNLYPHDIEEVIEREVDLVRQGRIAAFPVTDDAGEGIGIAVEISRRTRKSVSAAAIAAVLSEVVADAFMEPARVVILLEPGALPRTSSGKLQRSAVARGHGARSLDAYAIVRDGVVEGTAAVEIPSAPPGPAPLSEATLDMLAALWAEVLGPQRITPHTLTRESHFFALGGNSVEAMRVSAALTARLGFAVPVAVLFAHPRLGALADALAALPRTPAGAPPAAATAPAGPPPLTAAQRRMWFQDELAQNEQERAVNHVAGGLRFEAPVNAPAMAQALQDMVARHGALRTRFVRRPAGDVVQEELPNTTLALDILDLSAPPDAVRAAAETQARTPFDLSAAPLARALLVRHADGRDELLVTLHHLVCDGWSLDLLCTELIAAYARRCAGLPPETGPAPSYSQLAHRSADPSTVADGAESLSHWVSRLTDAPTLSTLPADGTRPAQASQQGGRLDVRLEPDLAARLRALAAACDATMPMAVFALLATLVQRLSGSRDLCLGLTFANRTAPDTQAAVGLFVNTLPVRLKVDAAAPFGHLLRQVRQEVVDAQPHQSVPLERILEALGTPRSLSRHPLFQILYSHLPRRAVQGVETFTRDTGGQAFDLALESTDAADGGLHLAFGYALDLFSAAAMARIADAFRTLALAVCDAPDMALDALPLVDAQTFAAYAAPWPDHRPDRVPEPDQMGPTPTIPALIAAHAQRTPGAPAIICAGTTTTFGELEAAANRLARALTARGVGPETRVGVGLPRGPGLIAALLAVWKAGGAFVPFDPAYPAARIAHMLDDAGAHIVLAEGDSLAGRPCLDPRRMDLSDAAASVPDAPIHAEQLAYIVYTSGSTGQPKGVMVAHGALAMHCRATGAFYETSARTREFHFLSMSFDGAHERWIVPLIHGGAIILTDRTPWDTPDTLDTLACEQATHAGFPPAYLDALAATAAERGRPPVDIYSFGGEAMTAARFARIDAALKPRLLINGYGPTEAVISPLAWKAPSGTAIDTPHVPIGRAVGARRAYVLDGALNPLPAGIPGELYVAGEGLARGYAGLPGATAARFLPDPYGPPGSRMYRTGDRARWRDDGTVDYLGRIDRQIKLRGFRIEPGEVEAALCAVPGVTAAAVALKTLAAGPQLVGYVVGEGLDLDAVRAHLSRHLPDHMVPARLIALPALPLSPNGKVDLEALPQPEQRAGANRPPQTQAEQVLADIWAEVLRLPAAPDTSANFFELGGDSILSLRIVARARAAGLALSARDLFEHQTIAALARAARPAETTAPALAPSGPLPLTRLQRRFLESAPQPEHFNQSLRLRPRRPISPDLLEAALARVGACHPALHLRFVRDGAGGWQQDGGPVRPLPLSRMDAPDLATAALHVEALEKSFNLAEGPLLRGALARLPDGGQVLFLTAHHLVIDAVSWRVLIDDIAAAYGALEHGRAPCLPPEGTPFAVRAAYVPSAARIPTGAGLAPDHGDGANTFRHRRLISLEVGAARLEALRQVAFAHHARLDDLLLAALVRAAGRLRGLPQVTVGIERHGRDLVEGADFSRTVGWFTAIGAASLPLEDDLRRAILGAKEARRSAQPDADGPAPCVLFNHLGRVEPEAGDGLFVLEAMDISAHPDLPLGAELTVDALEHGDDATLRLTASAARWDEATLTRLITTIDTDLDRLAQLEGAGASPSDFPLAGLTQGALDRLALPWREIVDLYPLTPTQQGILFHASDAAAGGAYVNQLRVTLSGIDPDRFAAAFTRAVARHDVLRTGFLWCAEQAAPLQAVWRAVPFAVRRPAPVEPEDDAARDAIAQEEREAGFALDKPPLMRLCLVPVGAHAHHLIWTAHHLLLDGWSAARLMAEVLADHEGMPPVPPPARFRDHVARLLARGRDTTTEGIDAQFWRGRLGLLEEPTLITAPATAHAQSAHHSTALNEAMWTRIAAAARAERVTVNTLFQAAWALVLRTMTGRSEVAFGVTLSGRPEDDPRMEEVLGLFITTVPILLALPRSGAVGELLQKVQAEALAIAPHAATPLVDILKWAGRSGQALFDTLLVFENYPMDEALMAGGGGLGIGPVSAREATNFPLTLSIVTAGAPRIDWSYDASRLTAAAVETLHARLLLALELLSGDRNTDLGAVSLALPAELDATRSHAGAMAHPAPLEPVHMRISAQARLRPHAVAVTCGDDAMTYAELEQAAERLAQRLADAGAGPGEIVGIAAERSAGLIAGLLAILKTGAAYLPLDPIYPEARLAHMARDAGIRLILADDAPTLGEHASNEHAPRDDMAGVTRIALDLPPACTAPPPARDWPVPHPDQPAYVIYTSGSTGTPKGVVVTHANLSRLLTATAPWFSFGPHDVWTLFHAYGFDFSVWEIFGALAHGGRLVVVPSAVARAPEEVLDLVVREKVSVLNQTPSAFRSFMQAALARTPPPELALRTIIFGGEALDAAMLAPWYARFGTRARLVNMYGITETTVHVTFRPLTPQDAEAPGHSPIGDPIPDLTLHLLDGALDPVPDGVAGEICIGGAGLAAGYLHRPSLTATRFVPDPHGPPGSRLYLSGDRAVRRPDGTLHYLGRGDTQVKIRGFRIELGEIEARLRAEAGVHAAAVLVRETPSGPALVAYLVVDDAGTLPAMRERLRATLPDYMVPAHLLALDALPLTANGKLDRAALPQPQGSAPMSAPPQGDTETALAAIWRDVLGASDIGRDDNFFALGGHSLSATQVRLDIQARLGVDLAVRRLFECQTLRGLARLVDDTRSEAAPARGATTAPGADLAHMDALLSALED